ncbi:MAG TPA: hypothetical protein VN736_06015 [Candidatus Limnocylindrales bacterium]|jgi:hypothetical protein|nr:hypothetical protein [Candidatus Limnocylindrales bacterium]
MIDANTAVTFAEKYLRDIKRPTFDFRIEVREVELIEDSKFWRVTLFATAYGLGEYGGVTTETCLKVLTLNATSGALVAMKDRI